MKISPTNQIIATVCGLFLGLGVLITVVAAPSLKGIMELSSSIKEERLRIEKNIGHGLKLRQNTEDLAVVSTRLKELEKMLVLKGKEISFFSFIENKSREYSLTSNLQIAPDADTTMQQSLKNIPIGLDLEGSFPNVLKFISSIEHAQTLIPLRTIDIRLLQKKDGEKQQRVTASIKGNIYVTTSQ